ncbi:ChrA protein [Anoxybacillus ayderensis]|uniref:chromate efflux transporter n=1 Tax=Anoxybacillus sp. ST70 TaxID=2864180 RepID=UPI0002E38AF6|nr:chromate efflux transporter [Anoxybacillus sp. ST70]AXM90354.1 ChrA protein [Anoxybacillus ayderensis G10]MBW9218289.1 chromate efflux transporter [Anoxybacillus sp. ST70]THD17459.1 ChrA protein [Anoxybacillus ayderensis]
MHSENRTKYVQKLWEVWKTAARLGLVSFGGPVAHLGYFREEYVKRKQWIDEKTYADLVALCQLLPGPASSQVGIGIGFLRAGMLGAIAAWLGFTLPSALILLLLAYFSAEVPIDWLHGLLVVAVAVVAHAVWGMAKVFTPDRSRATIAVASAILSFWIPNAGGQVAIIIVAGMIGSFLYRHHSRTAVLSVPTFPRKTAGVLFIFFMLLGLLPIVARLTSSPFIALFDSFYRAGALVFGGGHVVLPLLQSEVVPKGWVTDNQFLAGYGMAQAVPGPLFTFATYVGMASFGWKGAIVATIAIFLPPFLLVIGTLPFWEWIRQHSRFQAAFHGIHAAVVGLLLAALYHPVWTKAIQTPADFCLALAAFCLLAILKCPPLVVVIISAMIGAFS